MSNDENLPDPMPEFITSMDQEEWSDPHAADDVFKAACWELEGWLHYYAEDASSAPWTVYVQRYNGEDDEPVHVVRVGENESGVFVDLGRATWNEVDAEMAAVAIRLRLGLSVETTDRQLLGDAHAFNNEIDRHDPGLAMKYETAEAIEALTAPITHLLDALTTGNMVSGRMTIDAEQAVDSIVAVLAGRGEPQHTTSSTSVEALAALMTINSIALGKSTMDAINCEGLKEHMPKAFALGDTNHGWRSDVMLRGLYKALSPEHRALVDGDLVGFPTPIWEMMTGEIVSL